MCVIIDGMDQAKLMIPQFCNKSKAFSEAYKVRTHLVGLLDHGYPPLYFIDLFQWPHDTNLTLNSLNSGLGRRKELPDVLYLQMDNCWREGKNRFVLTYFAVLVQLGIFKKVRVTAMSC